MSKSIGSGRKSRSKPLVLFTLLIFSLFAVLFAIMKIQEQQSKEPVRHSEVVDLDNQPVFGDADAPVTLIEFGDYKCPSCKAWAEMIYPQLEKDYIDSGKLKLAYINTLFHGAESQLAALAAEAVWAQDPQSFWNFHKALFVAQPQQDHDAMWVTPDKMKELAQKHAPLIDLSRFADDMDKQTHLPELVIDMDLVEQFKVQQTPTIMINGTILDNPFDYNKMKQLIEQELEARS